MEARFGWGPTPCTPRTSPWSDKQLWGPPSQRWGHVPPSLTADPKMHLDAGGHRPRPSQEQVGEGPTGAELSELTATPTSTAGTSTVVPPPTPGRK